MATEQQKAKTFMRSTLVIRPLVFSLVLAGLTVLPINAQVQNRIVTSVSGSSRGTIAHTIPARARLAADLGEAPANRILDAITIHFNMSATQQADLNQFLADVQNPNSASYHQWLTPAQFGARFGLSSSDLAKVTSWVTGQGLSIVSVSPSSNYVIVSGTVSQVEKAFNTSIHAMSENGQMHVANITDPQLPMAIANVVTGITGLHDFKPRSRASIVRPQYTSSVSGSHYMAPGDFYTIYDINQLISNSITGQGINIAVVGQTDISTSDVSAFRSASGLSTSNLPTTVRATGYVPGIITSDIDEAQLDVEWSGAVAQNASIQFVTVGAAPNYSVIDALFYAISNNVAPIISISYGACESAWGQSSLNSINQALQQANAQGITVVGPAGDSGATDCDVAPPAGGGLTVDFPASSPFATAAGGTMFNEGSGNYWNTSNGNNSGSATGYIPEAVWNESNSSGFGAGGGGASAYFTKPSWQTGNGVPSDSARDLPDIAFNAAAKHDGYLFCSQGSCTNGYRNSAGNLNVVGGTSVAAPSTAGVLALLEQHLGGGTANRLGNANPMIYGLANSTYYNSAFHDVTSGNNDSACQQGTPNCPSGGSIGYNAATGYDLATGWGSLDVYNFVTKWNLVTPAGGGGGTTGTAISSTTISAGTAPLCANATGTLALTITIGNASGTNLAAPTGTVQLLVDGNAVSGTGTLSLTNGAVSYTLNTSSYSSGSHTITAIYSGDGNYATSKGTLTVDLVSGKDFGLTPCSTNATVVHGASTSGITLTLTPSGGFTGTVTLTASAGGLGGTFTFSPTTVAISGTSPVTASLVIGAYQTTTARNTPPSFGKSPWYLAGSGTALACVLFITVPRRRRWGALLALLLSVAAISASGCGSSSSTTNTGGGSGGTTITPSAQGSYTVSVSAVSGSLAHSSTINLTVQ